MSTTTVGSHVESAVLLLDHVWSYRPGFGLITPQKGGARGDPRGFWLALRRTGQVELYRARQARFDPSARPDFSAATPAATQTQARRSGLLMNFGGQERMVWFTGKSESPTFAEIATMVGLVALGPVGEFLHLGVEASELKPDDDRRRKAIDAWVPLLLGKVPWTAFLT